jgi:hypothetical protein
LPVDVLAAVSEPFTGENELFAGSENRFYLPFSDLEITSYRNDIGEVDRVVVAAEGDSLEVKKVP